MLEHFWQPFALLAPWLFLGAAIAGLLHIWVPRSFIEGKLRGVRGILAAVLLGVPLPLCSCSVIPAGIGLYRSGSSKSSALAFLVATPQTGIDSILVAAAMLGFAFAFAKVAVAFALGILIGLLVILFRDDGESDEKSPAPTSRLSWRDGMHHAIQIIRSIWLWLVAGVVISGVISLASETWPIAEYLPASPYLASLMMLVVAIPLYVCATASVPVAASLVAAGFPLASALVFLIAGPATNVATIGAVAQSFGKKSAALYLAVVVGGSWLLSILLVPFLDASAISTMLHEHGPAWWQHLGGVAMLALFVYFLVERIRPKSTFESARRYEVSGLRCGGCVKKLQTALDEHPAVDMAVVELKPPTLSLRASIDDTTLFTLAESLGYKLTPSEVEGAASHASCCATSSSCSS